MPIECIPISELTPASGIYKIKVRILRIWGFPKKDKPNELSSMDLLLIDARGNRIQASIKPNILPKFKDQLQEDTCCVLMNFELGPNVGQFRSCSHPYKISFIFYTCIKPCEELANTEFRFKLCPFPEIVAQKNDQSVFVDIIGEVVAMNEMKDVSTSDGKTKLLNLQLKDLGDSTLDIALWGKIGETVYSDVKSQTSGPVVFLGSLMKTMEYQSHGTAQTSKFSTKVYINPALPDIVKFREVLCKGDLESSMAIIPLHAPFSGQVSKTSFAISEMKTIAELSSMNQGSSCNVLATIVSIDTRKSWYFTGCSKCFTTATPYFNPNTEEIEPDKYSCAKCDNQITTTQTRFKVKFQVMDHSGTTCFISFDDVVIPLIKKSAYLLLEEQVQFNRSCETPPELVDLTGRQFVFKIVASNSEQYSSSSTYRVLSLTDAVDIIQSFSDCSKAMSCGELGTTTSSAPSVETTTQNDGNPQALTVSGVSSSIMSSEVDHLDTSYVDVNVPTPTSKRSLRHPRDEVLQQSSTKPKLMYTVKKEKK